MPSKAVASGTSQAIAPATSAPTTAPATAAATSATSDTSASATASATASAIASATVSATAAATSAPTTAAASGAVSGATPSSFSQRAVGADLPAFPTETSVFSESDPHSVFPSVLSSVLSSELPHDLPPGMLLAADLARVFVQSRRLWGRPVSSIEPEVSRRLGLLRQREKSISDCLIVVMLGGTKVGKTTTINALAGRSIGESSAKACFTSRPAIYVHRRREALARTRLAGILREDDTFVVHDEDGLERIILVDTPDLDGVEAEHHEVFRKLLERADLALSVVTTQKYDSRILYEILGREMGFRRVVFVFNRIDEGIPFSEKIRMDLLAKIAPLNLRPPDGEELPLFTVSARNALAAKEGQAAGPTGQFPALEAYLRQRLDQALVKRISEENVAAMRRETAEFIFGACRVSQAQQFAAALKDWAEGQLLDCQSKMETAIAKAFCGLTPEIIRRREGAAAEGLSGPFGIYVRLILAVNALASRFQMFLSGSGADLEGVIAQRLLAEIQPVLDDGFSCFRRLIAERADRAELDSANLLGRLEKGETLPTAVRGSIRDQISEFVFEPKTSGLEAFFLNLLPVVIILLLVRYFAWALLSASEPGAGMFLGGGVLILLVCHLQSSFWLKRKGGTLSPAVTKIIDLFAHEVRRRMVEPIREWADEVGKIEALPTSQPSEHEPHRD